MTDQAKSARVLLLAQVARALIQLVSVTTLSRLLAPEDFGTAAVVISVMAIASLLGDLGLSTAAIREPELTRRQWSSLFWLNLSLGVALTAVMAALAVPLAFAMGNPRLTGLVLAVSPVFLLNSLSVQYRVDLVRSSRYSALALLETAAPAVTLVVAVAWSLMSPGPMVLVVQQLSTSAMVAVLAIAVSRRAPLRPQFRGTQIGSIVKMGIATASAGVLYGISVNLPPILLGRFTTPYVVGQFSRSFTLSTMPHLQLAGSVARVAVPTLSQAHRDGELATGFRKALMTYGYTVAIATALIGGASQSVVALALGSQWLTTTPPLVAIISYGYILMSIGFVGMWALVAAGKPKLAFSTEGVGHLVTITLTLVLATRGATYLAFALLAGILVRGVAFVIFGARAVGVRRAEAFAWWAQLVAVASTVFLAARLVDRFLGVRPLVGAGGALLAAATVLLGFAAISTTMRSDMVLVGRRILKVAGVAALTARFTQNGR